MATELEAQIYRAIHRAMVRQKAANRPAVGLTISGLRRITGKRAPELISAADAMVKTGVLPTSEGAGRQYRIRVFRPDEGTVVRPKDDH